MRLKNQTKGPATLTRIDYSPRLSEETLAFSADLTVGNVGGTVRNDGRGGATMFRPRALELELKKHTDTLPRKQYPTFSCEMDPDLFVTDMICDAIEQRERQQAYNRSPLINRAPRAATPPSPFQVGDRVSFGRPNGEKIVGKVIKVNKKSLKIQTEEDRGTRTTAGAIWRVGPGLCTKIEG